ncbi:MAG TPA: hypothetical protein VH985_26320 [Candidatus Binatia bacterium]
MASGEACHRTVLISMRPVLQRDSTGCGIASVAAIARVTYTDAKKLAQGLGIYVTDENSGPIPHPSAS